MQTFEVVFSGQTLPGAEPQQVRQGLQRLFKASDAVLEQFFSGRRIVVKRDLDAAGAEKYRLAFEQAGALLEVVMVEEAGQPVVTGTSASAPVQPAASGTDGTGRARAMLNVVPRDEYMAAFTHVQAPDFGLAAAGEDLLVEKPQQQVVEVDVSGISLAPSGSDLGQLSVTEPVIVPDISHLSIEKID